MSLIEQGLSTIPEESGLGMKDRVSLAKWAVEKVTGKAPQQIDTGSSLIINLMSKIDNHYGNAARQTQTALPGNIVPSANNAHLASKPTNPIDAWVNDHIPQTTFEKTTLQDAGAEPVFEAEAVRIPQKPEPEPESPHETPESPTPFGEGNFRNE